MSGDQLPADDALRRKQRADDRYREHDADDAADRQRRVRHEGAAADLVGGSGTSCALTTYARRLPMRRRSSRTRSFSLEEPGYGCSLICPIVNLPSPAARTKL